MTGAANLLHSFQLTQKLEQVSVPLQTMVQVSWVAVDAEDAHCYTDRLSGLLSISLREFPNVQRGVVMLLCIVVCRNEPISPPLQD